MNEKRQEHQENALVAAWDFYFCDDESDGAKAETVPLTEYVKRRKAVNRHARNEILRSPGYLSLAAGGATFLLRMLPEALMPVTNLVIEYWFNPVNPKKVSVQLFKFDELGFWPLLVVGALIALVVGGVYEYLTKLPLKRYRERHMAAGREDGRVRVLLKWLWRVLAVAGCTGLALCIIYACHKSLGPGWNILLLFCVVVQALRICLLMQGESLGTKVSTSLVGVITAGLVAWTECGLSSEAAFLIIVYFGLLASAFWVPAFLMVAQELLNDRAQRKSEVAEEQQLERSAEGQPIDKAKVMRRSMVGWNRRNAYLSLFITVCLYFAAALTMALGTEALALFESLL